MLGSGVTWKQEVNPLAHRSLNCRGGGRQVNKSLQHSMISARIGKEQHTVHKTIQAGPRRLPSGKLRRSCQPGEVGGGGVLEETRSSWWQCGCACQVVGGISGPNLKGCTGWVEAAGCYPVDPRSHGRAFGGMVILEASLAYLNESTGLGNHGGLGTRNQPQASPGLNQLCTPAPNSETTPPISSSTKLGSYILRCPPRHQSSKVLPRKDSHEL